MPMQTFVPAVTADEGVEVEVAPRILTARFGDGYAQESGDGINNSQDTMSPRWTNLRKYEADPMIAFLTAVAKTREPFWYTPNGETAPIAIKCLKFSYAWKRGKFCNLTAQFEETAARA